MANIYKDDYTPIIVDTGDHEYIEVWFLPSVILAAFLKNVRLVWFPICYFGDLLNHLGSSASKSTTYSYAG